MQKSNSKAEKAFINGKLFTVDEKMPYAEAVITRNNRIFFVGSTEQARHYITPQTEVIDLKGKLMLPGFIDNHVHFINGGFYLLGVNLRHTKSTDEFKQTLKNFVSQNRGKWITGGDWDHEAWERNELPVKEWIDGFTEDTPVLINRFDAHMALANSLALKLAGISKDTPDPEGGLIVKDKITGEPTGILKDNAIGLVNAVRPKPGKVDYEMALKAALDEAKKHGFTSVQDITFPDDFRTYQKFEKEGRLTCRIYTRLPIAECECLIRSGIKCNFGSEKLKIGSLKAFADGSLGSSTALFFEPYNQDTSTHGLAMDILTDGRLKNWALVSDRAGLQLSIHAIGDKANSLILDIFEEVVKSNPPWDRRFRIEHAQHVRKEDLRRFAGMNVIASVQPYHLIDDGCWAEKRIGAERLKTAYQFKSFIDSGIKVCFGSDWSVAPLDPLMGIYAAVTRRTLDGMRPEGWIPQEKISVEEAIRSYTINNAYASFEEDIKGSIEEGKLADLVVLSKDILSIDPSEIKDVRVEMTVFDGNVIYEA
ncbi:MAG: amidohydrolase [Ignavibacteria bacterium]|jgi:predicted amidohydrolase YtcJ|nr:amidohydrolase [Ignavibacteria bacterium]MCU7504799.1 amidohydrolase [Ignavibacteria bacterium]MCU7517685.1 amidohydrolase [Ignavibacteria bacterium]